MANSVQILDKIARNAQMLGLTVNSSTGSAVVIENGANDLTISYVSASIQSPMGGIDGTVSPFLGIGIAAPGKLQIKGAAGATFALTIDTLIAAKVINLCSAFGNDIMIKGSGNEDLGTIRGNVDLLGMGM